MLSAVGAVQVGSEQRGVGQMKKACLLLYKIVSPHPSCILCAVAAAASVYVMFFSSAEASAIARVDVANSRRRPVLSPDSLTL
jgi:hypothetical protein